jgi:MoxR-like ATPase
VTETVTVAEPRFDSAVDVDQRLRGVSYLPDRKIASVVHLSDRLAKPVLIEGPAGTGKTELAKSVAAITGARLIRLQCYEGLDESKALYEWDYRKQLLHIQMREENLDAEAKQQYEADLFGERFLLTRPLLEAIRADEPVVLLIDEVDRLDIETEALLLEVLSDYQVSIPELGTVQSRQIPLVFLTSNNSRDLSEALKRRCLYLHIDYPTVEREREIVLARVPGIAEDLATQLTQVIRSLRSLDLKKKPSVSETLDWARTLMVLGVDQIDSALIVETLPILLKHQSDIELAAKELDGSS